MLVKALYQSIGLRGSMLKIWLFISIFCFSSLDAKIYDCFILHNEMDLIEIRFHELNPYVDYFVVVEWDKTHRTGELKPFYFEQNKERFAQFADKIFYVQLTDALETEDGWTREGWHRNQIMRALEGCDADDLILISDANELIPGAIIPYAARYVDHYGMVGFWQKTYQWFLNRESSCIWSGTLAVRYCTLLNTSPQNLRNLYRTVGDLPRLKAGWHFSLVGGYAAAKEQFYASAGGGDEFCSEEEWRACVNGWPLVPIDGTYPRYVYKNIAYLTEIGLLDR
ncbi:MAG: hypothetical protein S4CHLAM123_13690 [Chlamydiales bacterium]|nr:hypothetical protein [Chlamydiales bacterium]